MTRVTRYKVAMINIQRAQQYHQAGRLKDAEEAYRELLSIDPANLLALQGLTELNLQTNRPQSAVETLNRIIAIEPEKLHWRDHLAHLLGTMGHLDEAADCYKDFVISQPTSPNAYFNFAWRLKQAGHLEDALKAYEAAITLDIEGPEEVYVNMGVIYSDGLRQEDEAMAMLKKALAINPNYAPALLNLGNLYEELGDKENARSTYETLLKVDPSALDALARLANVKTVEGPDDPLIQDILSAAKHTSTEPLTKASLYFAAGKSLNDCGDYDAAFLSYEHGNAANKAALRSAYNTEAHKKYTDSLIETFSNDWFKNLEPLSEESPIFICGMFRSGSTLAEQILASHHQITAGGELDFFPHLVHSRLMPFPISMPTVTKEALRAYSTSYIDMLKRTFATNDYVTDKRPDNFLYLGLIKSLFPNARIIHTQRNPLDNCLSVFFVQLANNMSYANNIMDIGHYYSEQQRLMDHWKRLFGENIHSLNYDKLVSDPRNEIQDTLRFLQLDWDENCLNFHKLGNMVKTASYWQVREPLYTKSSGRWRDYEKHLSPLKDYLEKSGLL